MASPSKANRLTQSQEQVWTRAHTRTRQLLGDSGVHSSRHDVPMQLKGADRDQYRKAWLERLAWCAEDPRSQDSSPSENGKPGRRHRRTPLLSLCSHRGYLSGRSEKGWPCGSSRSGYFPWSGYHDVSTSTGALNVRWSCPKRAYFISRLRTGGISRSSEKPLFGKRALYRTAKTVPAAHSRSVQGTVGDTGLFRHLQRPKLLKLEELIAVACKKDKNHKHNAPSCYVSTLLRKGPAYDDWGEKFWNSAQGAIKVAEPGVGSRGQRLSTSFAMHGRHSEPNLQTALETLPVTGVGTLSVECNPCLTKGRRYSGCVSGSQPTGQS